MKERKKILISSFSFAPNHGSESELSWRFVERLKKEYRVLVCADVSYREFVSQALEEELLLQGVELKFFGFRGWRAQLASVGSLRRIYYYLWQKALPGWVARDCDLTSIDLVHHVSWATFTSPSFLWKLGKPFFFGPVGGGETFPWAFVKSFRLRTQLYELVRILRIKFSKFQPHVKSCLNHADLVWCANLETLAQCRAITPGSDLRLKSQVSVPDSSIAERVVAHEEFIIVTAARLIPVKRVDLIIKGFLAAQELRGKLVIVGDGEESASLQTLVEGTSSPHREVILKGWLEREELLKELKQASLFAFASLHDSASFAVLEAMSMGLPVVCLKFGGPAFLVGGDAGTCLSVKNDDEAIAKFADSFTDYYREREKLATQSLVALARAEKFSANSSWIEFSEAYQDFLK